MKDDAADEKFFAQALSDPEVHRQVVGHVSGAYSLGVGRPAETGGRLALVARIREERATELKSVKVGDRSLPVVIIGGFGPPRKL